MNPLEQTLQELAGKVVANNLWRQRRCFNLIPSENTPSLLVKLCEIGDPAGRYAEHKTALKKEIEALTGTGALKGDQVYYYQATDFIFEVEERLKREFGRFIGASEVEARPISGQMANEIVFKACVKFFGSGAEGFPRLTDKGRLATVMNNNLNYGGHLSAQPFGALFNFVDGEVVNFPLLEHNPYKIHVHHMLDLVQQHRPPLIVFGKSMFLHPEPIRELRQLVDSIDGYRPVIMYDGAHVMGVLGAHFQDPLAEGADVVTGSTHKTFFGPQRGVIAGNFPKGSPMRKLWLEVNARSFPGSTSNHHLGTLLAMLAATLEMNQFKDEYQRQVLANARAFAGYCAAAGIPVEGGEEDGYTHTHQVVIRVKPFGDGKEIASRLEAANIVTNYQALPDDETFYHPSGIRMGVQEMTRFGMKEKDFERLAGFIADIVIRNKDLAGEVAAYRQQFARMQYCLSPEETLRVAPGLLESIFPDYAYFQGFAEALRTLHPGLSH
jgi:glycine/serine hydroxymethyltransferase